MKGKHARDSAPLPPPWATCDPEDVGMDSESLEKCRRYLRYRVNRKHFNGIVGGVVKNGKLVYFDEVGYADVETKTPMKQDTIMRLFSMTKCLVAVCFLTYAEDPANNIELDDPVWKYIPSFKKACIAGRAKGSFKDMDSATFTVGDQKEVLPTLPTLRQLLTHTAGLGYGPSLGDKWPPENKDHFRIYENLLERVRKEEITNLAAFIDELAKVPFKAKPGSYWEYSFATDVLGRVIEVVSGKNLEEAVQERVCRPLGMVDTSFFVPPEKLHRVSAWYKRENPKDDQGNVIAKVQPGATYSLTVVDKPGAESGYAPERCSKILSGGGTVEVPLAMKGGMVSTFKDYLRFLMMIRGMGQLDGTRILKRETVQTMVCNQVPAATGRRTAWVFDKKGQGYNFLGQIQVQFTEKETHQEKGEIKKGGTSLACLAPGTVSGEFGWGGLAGPAWTIDPRADLIILSMTQTALELDHEENLRYSARRSIHVGIFGPTVGSNKITDYPPEFHQAEKTNLRSMPSRKDVKAKDGEELMFQEAEQQALQRSKTLKELALASGNIGHEVKELDDELQEPAAKENEAKKEHEAAVVQERTRVEQRKRELTTPRTKIPGSKARTSPHESRSTGEKSQRTRGRKRSRERSSNGSPSPQRPHPAHEAGALPNAEA